jgi:hypothetical protein
MTEVQLVDLERVIQNVQGHPMIALAGGVLSVALWVYLARYRRGRARKSPANLV